MPPEQSHVARGSQQFHIAPGSLPQAHSFMPFVQSPAGPAANAGCALIAATMNADAKIIFFIHPSDLTNRLKRAPFPKTPAN
jgi:hypothetical protein